VQGSSKYQNLEIKLSLLPTATCQRYRTREM